MKANPFTVLFDLDGTLADTAPDLARAFYRYCDAEKLTRPDFARLRSQVSNGVFGMLTTLYPNAIREQLQSARDAIVAYYAEALAHETQLFAGVPELLEKLDAEGIAWGVVTNKPGHLTAPLLEHLGLQQRAACIVSGDTTPYSKPHPGSLLHAVELLGLLPQDCLYVGDAERDVQAGRAAGMPVVVAGYGYIDGHDVPAWQADGIIDEPLDLLTWLPRTRS